MRLLATILLLVAMPAAKPEVVEYPAAATTRGTAFAYSRGYLARFDPDAPEVALYDRSGRPIYEAIAQATGGALFRILDLTVTGDGEIVAAGYWTATDRGFIVLDQAGRTALLRETASFSPQQIRVGPSGGIWVIGFSSDPPSGSRPSLRRYSREGKPLAGPLEPGALPEGVAPRAFTLEASNTRMALWAEETGDWIEFDTAGNVAARLRLPSPSTGPYRLTFGAAGEIYRYNTGDRSLYLFDRTRAEWSLVHDVIPNDMPAADLVAADGPRLVFRLYRAGELQLLRLPH